MSGLMYHTPAQVVKQLMLDLDLCGEAEGTADWPCYYSHFPDSPDDALCVRDTEGRQQGRSHVDGEVFEHPGIQVALRANDVIEGRAKAEAIAYAFDTSVSRTEVELEEYVYLVQCINRTGNVLSLGPEVGLSRRRLFTINAVVGLRLIGPLGTGT